MSKLKFSVISLFSEDILSLKDIWEKEYEKTKITKEKDSNSVLQSPRCHKGGFESTVEGGGQDGSIPSQSVLGSGLPIGST